MSDNCYIGGDGVSEEQLDNLTVSATNSVIATSWSQFYAIVGSATNVIENVKLMDSSLIDDATRAQIIADAKFARAWVLFDIVKYWGDAPMTLQLIPSITVDNIDNGILLCTHPEPVRKKSMLRLSLIWMRIP